MFGYKDPIKEPGYFFEVPVKDQVIQDEDPFLEVIPKEEGSNYPFVRIIFSYFLGGTLLGFLLGLAYCLTTIYPVVGSTYLDSKIYVDLSTMIPVGFIAFFVPSVVLLFVLYWVRWTRGLQTAIWSGFLGGALMTSQMLFYGLMIGKDELDQTVQVVSIAWWHYVVIFVLYACMTGVVAYLSYPNDKVE